MLGLAHVLLPHEDTDPAAAIRASLERFRRGGPGDVPDAWLGFDDETASFQETHEAHLTLSLSDTDGLQIAGSPNAVYVLDAEKVVDEMRRRNLRSWSVRFADLMSLDTFFDGFCVDNFFGTRRDPATGLYGRWLNSLGRWDWWALGGRFDGALIGDRTRSRGRRASRISSGENQGRTILANVVGALGDALGQQAAPVVDVRSDRNIELAATLLANLRACSEHVPTTAIVLPPGIVEDELRWIGDWPEPGPASAFTWLGLEPDADWWAMVEAAYARCEDHWVAGVAYHF